MNWGRFLTPRCLHRCGYKDFFLVNGTDKGFIECLNNDNYFTVSFIVARNIEIVPQNECYNLSIVGALDLDVGVCTITSMVVLNTP